MPAWVKDHGIWNTAKKAVLPHADKFDEPYAVVAHVYKNMGGSINKQVAAETMPDAPSDSDMALISKHLPDHAKQASASSATSQLNRPTSRKIEAFRSVRSRMSFGREAVVDREAREVDVLIITEGAGNEADKHYYTAEAVADGVEKFAGARAFFNHQTEGEEESRPEQDINELCGFYKNLKLTKVKDPETGKQVAALAARFVAEVGDAGDKALAIAETQILYRQVYPESKDCYSGISVNTGGWSDGMVEINGEEWTRIVAFEGVRSADFVTRPARGGAFLKLAESLEPVGSNNLKESDMKNAKRVLQLVGKLEESDKLAKAETDSAKKKTILAESQKLRDEMKLLLEAEDGEDMGTGKKEGEDDAAGKDGADDDSAGPDAADALDALKKHMPQKEDEDEAGYASRLKQAFGHAKKAGLLGGEGEAEDGEDGGEAFPKKEAKRGRESATVKEFRTKHPKLHAELMAGLRESLGAQRLDFKGVKVENESLRGENANLRLERDLGEAEKALAKAGIPRHVMTPGELVKLDEAERVTMINRMKMIMEGAGAAAVWTGSGPSHESEGHGDGLDLAAHGIPMVEKTEE